DAMILLEREGKAYSPNEEMHSTAYRETRACDVVPVKASKESREEHAQQFKDFVKKVVRYLSDNHLKVSHHEEPMIDLPLWGAVLVLAFGWWVVLILIAVSLFFDWRYQFYGKNNLDGANHVMDKVKETAEHVKEDFNKEA
nr:hypothetical protein [Lachnospiraceae bacterium]